MAALDTWLRRMHVALVSASKRNWGNRKSLECSNLATEISEDIKQSSYPCVLENIARKMALFAKALLWNWKTNYAQNCHAIITVANWLSGVVYYYVWVFSHNFGFSWVFQLFLWYRELCDSLLQTESRKMGSLEMEREFTFYIWGSFAASKKLANEDDRFFDYRHIRLSGCHI